MKVLDELVESVPAMIRAAGLKDNACILATRMGVEALRACGLRARPLAVRLLVMNPLYREMLKDPAIYESPARVEEWGERGAWSVVIGFGGGNGTGWDGHLITIVEERYMVDLTAGQVKRLASGIKADAFWHDARELARGEVITFSNEEDGCAWIYDPRPEDKSFLTTPAWSGYRVSVRGGMVISERSRLADVPAVAKEIRLPLPTGGRR